MSGTTWTIAETGVEYVPYENLHCMVLYGYDEEFYYVCDPLFGLQTVSRLTFKEQFGALGNRAVILSASRADTPFLRDAP